MKKQFERHGEETWRDVVGRISKRHGMQVECLQWFDNNLSANAKDYGADNAEKHTAWEALYEWDCLPVEEIV